MNAVGRDPEGAWSDAALAIALFAIHPFALGGVIVRGSPGPLRDRVCTLVRDLLSTGSPVLRVPIHVTDDRLLGGLSLAATLGAGRPIFERGLLAQADGGVLLLPMAERLEPRVTAQLCAALDRGELAVERDGTSASVKCRVGVVALDEGMDGEGVPTALCDRLAFRIDLSGLDAQGGDASLHTDTLEGARSRLHDVAIDDALLEAICQSGLALGIRSLRGTLLATEAARAHAALAGRTRVEEEDAAAAARLVLGPRATCLLGESADSPSKDSSTEPPPSHVEGEAPEASEAATKPEPDRQQEVVLQAAKSGIPAGLLDDLVVGRAPRDHAKNGRHAGATCTSTSGGRPAGTRAGDAGRGDRLSIVETLRAAAPWQPLRRRQGVASEYARQRIEVRKEDFRVNRFVRRTETCVIFSVDASGSAAFQRLAEAKGAVERVLADCYVRRDHVALISFRGTAAAVLLPPTRSLTRVRRTLAELPGGGTTPLSAGIDAALALALESRKRGRTPIVVFMTDGRGNVARDGSPGGPQATADALASARSVRAAGVRALFLDTSPRPRPEARLLATTLGARYLPLPYLDAAGISRHVQSMSAGDAP